MYPQVIVVPSLLAADYSNLASEVKRVEEAGADWIHIDVMDGHFVKNITVGPLVVEAVRKSTNLPLDVHLMIQNPQQYISDFLSAGADIITIHAETLFDSYSCRYGVKITPGAKLNRSVFGKIRKKVLSSNKKLGVALNPGTDVSVVKDILKEIDLLLVMSVWPGFGGQRFIQQAVRKISKIRRQSKIDVEVDGGIDPQTAPIAASYGANIFVAGTAIFDSPDASHAISLIRKRTQRVIADCRLLITDC